MADVSTLNLSIPQWSDLAHFLPESILMGVFLLALLADIVVRGRHPVAPFLVTLAGLLAALAFAVADLPQEPRTVLGDLLIVDGMATFFRILFILASLAVVLFAWASEEIMGRGREHRGEFYALTALLTAGMCVMAEAREIVMVFLAVEMVGLTSYVMAGYMRRSLRSTEASLKYVIYGGVSSGIMLYGLSLLYGLTGQTTFGGIQRVLAAGAVDPFALLVVMVLILAGLGYKIAMVPFHFWAPDVYEGAPTPVAALFSVGPKAAGFALMIRFFYGTMVAGPLTETGAVPLLRQVDWPLLIAVLSVVTMTFGNVVALRQNNIKRMLAYSSIAHVGYLLMGFLLLTQAGLQAILFYLLVYAIMNLGAFLFVVAINNRLRSEELEDYAGLGFRAPWAAAMMIVFLFSLTGLPPTAGFIGKFYLFAEVMNREYFWLAIVGVLNSVISLFYYMRIARAMYFTAAPDGAEPRLALSPLHMVVLAALAVPTLVFGIYWAPLKAMADQAIGRFAGM